MKSNLAACPEGISLPEVENDETKRVGRDRRKTIDRDELNLTSSATAPKRWTATTVTVRPA